MCGETEILAHALVTTVNQLKEPAAADEEIDMAQSWLEQDTPTGFQRQFNVSDSINCLCPNVHLLRPLRYHFVYDYCYGLLFCG